MARRSSSEHAPLSALERCTVVLLGVYLAAVGVHTMAAGHVLYSNYLRSVVAAPIAIVIGALLIAAGFWMPD